jgi:hypothetical protein
MLQGVDQPRHLPTELADCPSSRGRARMRTVAAIAAFRVFLARAWHCQLWQLPLFAGWLLNMAMPGTGPLELLL